MVWFVWYCRGWLLVSARTHTPTVNQRAHACYGFSHLTGVDRLMLCTAPVRGIRNHSDVMCMSDASLAADPAITSVKFADMLDRSHDT
jgi:hypothetical protein